MHARTRSFFVQILLKNNYYTSIHNSVPENIINYNGYCSNNIFASALMLYSIRMIGLKNLDFNKVLNIFKNKNKIIYSLVFVNKFFIQFIYIIIKHTL